MTTPPKAPCHYCNGTGIDPTVGFLDCEFCAPAFAGVSMLAPEQPEPKCATCNDHGEIGCLRPDGYDSERCPDCNPAAVKRYHVTEAGLVEGEALGRINVVLGTDYDAVVTHIRELELLAGQEMKSTELATNAGLRVCLERDALQQRLTAADERADVLEGLVGEVLDAVGREPLDLDAVLRLRARMRAALKPAEGVGDDTTLEEDREDFKKVFVRINTKQGQSISLADMIARYEKKP